MATAQRIKDFEDPTFDPFTIFDQVQGFGEVEDPYPRIHAMHNQGTVLKGDLRQAFGLPRFPFWEQYPAWMIFGYDAVARVFTDSTAFSSSIKATLQKLFVGDSINGMDAPEHLRYRGFFQKAFLPQTILRWGEELVPRVVAGLIDKFADRGRAELVSEFTALYPFHVIYGQLHLPLEDREVFQKLTFGAMCASVDLPHSQEASQKLIQYFSTLLEDRRLAIDGGAPLIEEDLIGMLAVAEIKGERLPDELAVSFLRQLMAAAGETTFRGTSALLLGLLTNPEQLEAVRVDRSLVPLAIEEALRWEPPITFETRQSTRDVVIDGVDIPAGCMIDVVIGSANRDPARYENPDVFDIWRKPARHVTFGFGPHVCLGQHLARMEITRALNALLDRFPKLRLDPEKPTPRMLGLNSRAPAAIHVRFD